MINYWEKINNKKNNIMRVRNLFALVALMSAVTMVSCGGGEKKAVVGSEAVKLKVVSLGDVTSNEAPMKVTYNGNIEPLKRNNIASSSPLRIEKIFVEVGDKVKRNAIVAEMDKSQLVQQSLQVENLAVDLSRMEELLKAGGATKQQVDQLRTQYDVAKKSLNYMVENTTLRTPINGVVTARNYDNGDMFSLTPNASGSVAVVTVMQIDSVKVRINIGEEYFTKIKNGMDMELTTDSYPEDIFNGKVSLIYPLIDASTHTFTIEVTIPNKDLRLRPGMFTKVSVNIGLRNLVVVDGMAIQKQTGSNEKFVYVYNDGTVSRRSVTVGNIMTGYTEVVSGLEVGEKVVVKGASKLLEGDKVEIAK